MERRPAYFLILTLIALPATTALGAPATLRGHIKGQQQNLSAPADSLASALGYGHAQATALDLRIIGNVSAGRFAFDADYLLQAEAGSAVALQHELERLEPALFIDRAKTQWLPLDDALTADPRRRAQQSLDRFSVSFTTESWVVKAGRQAYSWGNGIVFRPMDIFDPFAPDVIDDSYKPGIDALYAQRLFKDGSDVSALIVPRRIEESGKLASSASSAAVKWHRFGSRLQTDWLVARDHLDTLAGIGINGPLGQAVWRMSLVPAWLESGGTRTSLVVNLEQAWQWASRNISGFVEYYRNGFGMHNDGYALDDLSPELVARLARGQVFNTGRDYLAGGLRIQASPLIEIDPVLLLNLRDRSALALIRGSYSLAQDLSIDFGLRIGIGRENTEFGGLPTSAGSETYLVPAARVYARLAHFF